MIGEVGAIGGAKQRLLRAAGQFGRSSYHEVGIAQILKEAGVQPPTLYHHFGDKEGLFVAWAVEALNDLGQTIANACPDPGSTADDLDAIARCFAIDGSPDVIQLLRDSERLARAESREIVVESIQRSVFEPLYRVFLLAMERGVLRRDPVHKVSAAFLATSHSLRTRGLLPLAEDGQNAAWLVDRFLQGFGQRQA